MIVHICEGDVPSWNKADNVECVVDVFQEIMLKEITLQLIYYMLP